MYAPTISKMKLKHYLWLITAVGYAILAGGVMPWLMSYKHDTAPFLAIALGLVFFFVIPINYLISNQKDESSK